jgi:hypothetical protein
MQCTGCERDAWHGGLCHACIKSRQRNGSTARKKPERGVRHPNNKEMVLEAILDVADKADSINKKDWHRAWARFWVAVGRYRQRRGLNTVHR